MDDATFRHRIAEALACDASRADAVAFAVFRELRARLTEKEGGDVEAQLPTRVKHLWREAAPIEPRVEKIHGHEFIGRVRRAAALPDDREAERAVRTVFATLQQLLGSRTGTGGEAWDVFSVLPKDLKLLWLSAADPRP
jgi:uncharacterized protein (DUF2267 family)